MIHFLQQTDSTNNRLLEYIADRQKRGEQIDNLTTFYTDFQTAGRGQQGNTWESEAGKNLLFSTLIITNIAAEKQFRITELVSLAIAQVVKQLLLETAPEHANAVKIKWPNDIYIYDKKVCGILIENQLSESSVNASIVGVGLNVNQLVFQSSAPNPASLRFFAKQQLEIFPILNNILNGFGRLLPLLEQPLALHQKYMAMLYRRNEIFQYIERECSTKPTNIVCQNQTQEKQTFLARIVNVDNFGRLILQDQTGTLRTYHFKQIQFVI